MSSEYIWDEALTDLIPELDWSKVSRERWTEIEKDLDDHVSQCQEFRAPTPTSADIQSMNESPTIARLQAELASAQREVEVYRNSVKRRRNTDTVYVDGDSVIYVP